MVFCERLVFPLRCIPVSCLLLHGLVLLYCDPDQDEAVTEDELMND